MEEERIERRFHWAQVIIGAIIAAVVWCCKLEFSTNSQSEDFKQYKRHMKSTTKEMDNAIDNLTYRIIVLETERNCKK